MPRGPETTGSADAAAAGEGSIWTDAFHVLKSLTWFEDAERKPLPRMLEPFDWDECRAFFVREAHAIVLP